ncbi:putative transcription factor Sef1p [Trichomonascus vanleenenianus]|uniref:Zn(II)2Cys6 transcription factor n=1 Tax=Trichomonascus vanleenenianus TaxID=2268995 RepID=UPI003ECAE0C4
MGLAGHVSNSTPSPSTSSSPDSTSQYSSSKQHRVNGESGGPVVRAPGTFRTRPIRSCTFCRNQKVRCDASAQYPQPCSKCAKTGRECVVDPYFKPQKGGQVQSLRDDLHTLRQQVEYLQKRESLLASAVAQTNPNSSLLVGINKSNNDDEQGHDEDSNDGVVVLRNGSTSGSANGHIHMSAPNNNNNKGMGESNILSARSRSTGSVTAATTITANTVPLSSMISSTSDGTATAIPGKSLISNDQGYIDPTEFKVGDVVLSRDRAEELHTRFMTQFLPYMPIIQSNSAAELFRQSELLFWTVCLTASLSEPEPSLYISLSGLIKQLAIETCWIRTPRSTHIVQALIILGTWPIPNEKVLDDCSYRFVGLAKNLAMQLGLHRGKFIYEFSRTQTSLPDAEKWRTRTWLACFFSEQVWSANLGLPPSITIDYLVEEGRTDDSLPKSFQSLLRLSIFYSKLVGLIGSSVCSADGLEDGKNRPNTLSILEQQLEREKEALYFEEPSVEIYYLYIKLMICCFSFLPGTPNEDQSKYVAIAFNAGTRVITLFSKLAEHRQIIEYPIYMRQAVSFAALLLFRLHLTPFLLPQNVESARQSVVTVHRLFRNMLTAWKDVENDLSRTAKVLEKLNFVIITHPYLLTQAPSIITRMRSHLTASIFYELIWAVHEARRRGAGNLSKKLDTAEDGKKKEEGSQATAQMSESVPKPLQGPPIPPAFAHLETVPPLPFYNQITRDDFTTNTKTTPNGTTVTTLVPTNPHAAAALHTMGKDNLHHSHAPSSAPQQHNPVDIAPYPVMPHPVGGVGVSSTPSAADIAAIIDSTGASNDPLHLDTLMQGIDWMNDKGDDFLGWMDVNVSPF